MIILIIIYMFINILFIYFLIKGNTVYRQFMKKIYINSPPAILILHLLRFKSLYKRTHKTYRHVSFPWVLDIAAPYCFVDCRVNNIMKNK